MLQARSAGSYHIRDEASFTIACPYPHSLKGKKPKIATSRVYSNHHRCFLMHITLCIYSLTNIPKHWASDSVRAGLVHRRVCGHTEPRQSRVLIADLNLLPLEHPSFECLAQQKQFGVYFLPATVVSILMQGLSGIKSGKQHSVVCAQPCITWATNSPGEWWITLQNSLCLKGRIWFYSDNWVSSLLPFPTALEIRTLVMGRLSDPSRTYLLSSFEDTDAKTLFFLSQSKGN